MKKLILLFICICCLFSINGISQSKKSKAKKAKQNKKTASVPIRDYFGVNALYLSQKEVFTKCSTSNGTCSEKLMQIEVRTAAVEINEMKYIHTVSAGRILGEGANVIWDLSDAKPGTYTITAGISQHIFNGTRWEVVGKTQTYTVTVKECPDCK